MSLALAAPAGSTRPLSGTTHMLPHGHDVAQTRLDNALALFDEFVQATVSHPDATALRGLERRFAEKVLIQPSYWSQIKSRSRQIGERLARQFEQCCHKPRGWMDEPHAAGAPSPSTSSPQGMTAGPARAGAVAGALPRDDEERFVVGLVLEYYRRDPRRAKARLLELLGDALLGGSAVSTVGPRAAPPSSPAVGTATASADDDLALWRRSQQQVAPLKPKR